MNLIKTDIFKEVRTMLEGANFEVVCEDQSRPWGGFFVLNEHQITKFISTYFPGVPGTAVQMERKLSPKILVVAPESRLSWQYHHRRSELWRVVRGPVKVAISDTDEEREIVTLNNGDTISLRQGQRHRLIGADSWGVVAEIWQHTDVTMPSDENDIVRVQDDFGR